ncbi:septal ring lytic transglycosylase RlpA family protein [Oxalobacteraceae bacterium A2-2]
MLTKRLPGWCAGLALLALVGCGTAPVAPTTSPAPVHKPAPSASKPSTAKPDPAVPVLPPAGSGRGGYYQDDGPGENPPPNLDKVPDADVRNDAPIPRANRPYTVFGKTYTPLTDNQPYTQIGIGSWYGKKFHGQRTSSGELYDMYKMTAAHPILPIPSYARLTNLVSGAQVIVRINDRGPFHSDRAIDVSYTAALKLGLLGKGSHELQIERILPDEIDRMLATKGGVSTSTPARLITRTAPAAPRLPSQAGALSANSIANQPLVLSPSAVPQSSLGGVAPAASSMPATAAPVTRTPAAGVALAAGAVPAPVAATGSATSAQSTAAAAPVVASATQTDIEALMLADRSPAAAAPAEAAAKGGYYLQLGAYSRAENAEAARSKLATQTGQALGALEVVQGGTVFRLFSGPYASRQDALQAAQSLPGSLGLKPIPVQR